jgi:AcrR family transcriptional regulator
MAKGKYEYWLTEDGLLLLAAWARDGFTIEKIAEKCGINKTTIYDWSKKYPDISNAIKKGKEIADIEVENALYKRAVGYDYQEIITEDGDNGSKTINKTRHMPPDVGACAIWLKNRKPDKWRDKPEMPFEKIVEKLDGILDKIEGNI